MNIIVIIILAVVLVLTFCLVTFFMFWLKKYKKSVLERTAKDLNRTYQTSQFKKLDAKDLPVEIEDIQEDIYFCNRVVSGKYENQKVIKESNESLSPLLQQYQLQIFYYYKIINIGSTKFIPLNKIEILITKRHLYLHHPLEPENLRVSKIKNFTIFWERNPRMPIKEYFPCVAFCYEQRYYFLLFQTYNEVLKFLACLNFVAKQEK